MRALAPDLELDSAGTSDWHLGAPPHPPMVKTAAERGIDMRDLRGRQVRARDFDGFDLIVAMDESNRQRLEALRPTGNTTPVMLLLDNVPSTRREVPDPYYTDNYDGALDLIEAGCRALALRLGV